MQLVFFHILPCELDAAVHQVNTFSEGLSCLGVPADPGVIHIAESVAAEPKAHLFFCL